jgi:hypothetical protein
MDPSAQSAVRSVAAIGLKSALRGRPEKGVDRKVITHAAARRCLLPGRDFSLEAGRRIAVLDEISGKMSVDLSHVGRRTHHAAADRGFLGPAWEFTA